MNILKQNTFKRRHTNIEKHKSINKTQLHTPPTNAYRNKFQQILIRNIIHSHMQKHTHA